MPRLLTTRPAAVALLAGGVLVGVFVALLLLFRHDLQEEIHRKIIERDAAVLYPVALQQLAEAQSGEARPDDVLAVLKSAQQAGMLGVAVFDADGNPLRAVPPTMLFADLPPDDYLELTRLKPLSRYHASFDLAPVFPGVKSGGAASPVLEVLLPLHRAGENQMAGVAQYFIDARPLAQELATIDRRIARQTAGTFVLGAALIFFVVAVASWALTRAQRQLAERNERLLRAHFELSLAAKASVLGQITSHLLHGLQGPVAGLRAVLAARGPQETGEDWKTAADYTERLQRMIQETVNLLAERSAQSAYELSGRELLVLLADRHRPAAASRGVRLETSGNSTVSIDSHRGNLLTLIVGNLIENAIQASPAGGIVQMHIVGTEQSLQVEIADEGPGLPGDVREHLFEPGRSGRTGGSGLGLAISHLLARQIGARITLLGSDGRGTRFAVDMPLTRG